MTTDERLRDLPFERVSEGVRVYDVSDFVKKRYPRRSTPKARRPKNAEIEALFVHHSGALGAPGIDGLLGAVRFVMQERRFPGAPYHFWAPHDELRDDDGHLALLRACEDEYRAWHTGNRANDFGIGLAFQGNLSRSGLSPSQQELLEAVVPWFAEQHRLPWSDVRSWLSWHSDSARLGGRPKATCPGARVVAQLREYLDRASPRV